MCTWILYIKYNTYLYESSIYCTTYETLLLEHYAKCANKNLPATNKYIDRKLVHNTKHSSVS